MPALSGSQKAYKQARAGIARAGATRCGYYTPYQYLTINGTDRSSTILFESVRLRLRRSIDQPDTATFTIRPNAGFVPTEGHTVVIGSGTSSNRIFGGQIVRSRHVRQPDHSSPFIEVECIDWSRLFNRRLITSEWSSTSASQIAYDLIDLWTSGFTRLNVAPDLPSIDFFPVTNELPTTVWRRLATLVGGGGYLDADRDAHLYGSSGEPAGRAPTAPLTLTNSLGTLKTFAHQPDESQRRTKVSAEGRRTQALLAIPIGATTIPLDDVSMWPGSFSQAIVRIGTQRLIGDPIGPVIPGAITTGENLPNGILTANKVAGSTAMSFTVTQEFFDNVSTNWFRLTDQILYFSAYGYAGLVLSATVPASGYGALAADVEAGAVLTPVAALANLDLYGTSIVHDIPFGTDVVMRAEVQDVAAQAALAAIEGGDGMHEHVIQDGRWTYEGALAAAQADLDAFSTAITDAQWETFDANALPNRSQVINLTVTDALSTTVTITETEVDWPIGHDWPRHACQGSSAPTSGLLDTVQTDPS